jgi:hypothetical protein
VAPVDLGIGEPAALVPEDERGPPLGGAGQGLAGEIRGRETPLPADHPRARPHHPGAVRHRLVERPHEPGTVEELLGVDRDPPRRREVVRAELRDRPVVEPEVPHRAGDRAQVLRVPRAQEHQPDGEV